MKPFKIVFVLACVIVGVASASAQRPGGGPGGPGGPGGGRGWDPKKMVERQMGNYQKELKLTPAQETKVRAIVTKSADAMSKIMASPGDFRAKMPQMMKMREANKAAMKKILSADQFKKLEEMEAKRMERMRQRGMGGPGGPGGGRPGFGGPGGPGGPGAPRGGRPGGN